VQIALPDSNYTLSHGDGTAPNQARNAVLWFTGSLTATWDVIVPLVNKLYIVYNDTNHAINIAGATGHKALVREGETIFCFCDGTGVYPGPNHTILQSGGGCTVTTIGNITTISVP
jgi:hypothetical protein